MFKRDKHLKEEDYWVYAVSFFGIFSVALVLYASVLTFRVPAILASVFLLWLSYNKINRSYSTQKAFFHLFYSLTLGILLALSVHGLTN